MKVEDLNSAFLDGCVDGYSTTCRRLNEQVKTGNVVVKMALPSLLIKEL
jgi:hypothetical protein